LLILSKCIGFALAVRFGTTSVRPHSCRCWPERRSRPMWSSWQTWSSSSRHCSPDTPEVRHPAYLRNANKTNRFQQETDQSAHLLKTSRADDDTMERAQLIGICLVDHWETKKFRDVHSTRLSDINILRQNRQSTYLGADILKVYPRC
jgi:hypothetical protein